MQTWQGQHFKGCCFKDLIRPCTLLVPGDNSHGHTQHLPQNNHSVVTVIMCYFSPLFWMQPLILQECCSINSPSNQCAFMDFIPTSLLPGFTWLLVRSSIRAINILSVPDVQLYRLTFCRALALFMEPKCGCRGHL